MKRVLPVVIAALLPIAFVTGYLARGGSATSALRSAESPVTPGEKSAEVGFRRDMSVHHSQAVDMAERMQTRTTNPAIRILIADIVLTQQNQIDPGMASRADVNALTTLPMADAERASQTGEITAMRQLFAARTAGQS